MIHHELGYAYIIEENGTKIGVESRTPRDAAIACDEGMSADEEMACRIESVRDWMSWIFQAGPEPVPAMRRLVACTVCNAPWLVVGLSKKEANAVSPVTSEKDSLAVVCRAKPAKVKAAMERARRREGRTWAMGQISTLEIMESVADSSEALIRAQAMEVWLARVWNAGPKLSEALKNLFVEARALAPELILNMSGEEISDLFGQGRAAESARVKKRVNDVFTRAGFRYSALRFQKSATACRKYAARAKGNKHRAHSISLEEPAA